MRSMRIASTALVLATALAIPAPAQAQSGPRVDGAGSTFSEVALKQWISDVSGRGLQLNYNGVGSTQGRNLYIERQVDFAVSEIPFTPEEIGRLSGTSFQYFPIVAGGTALMYHLKDRSGKRIENLRLTGEILALIFTGELGRWNDPKIAAENPDISLPNEAIKPVVRSDGSGTSAQFSAYLVKTQPAVIGDFFGGEPATSNWPDRGGVLLGQPRSDGVSNFVAANENTITYVEAAFAEIRKFPVAFIKNSAGKYAPPNSGNVALALEKATFNSDRTQNLDNVYTHPGDNAYPISSYSYMIAPTEPRDLTVEKANVLAGFMRYYACDGQRSADRLGYSPLPPNLVQGVFDAIRALPGDADPGTPTKENCKNPTLTGEAKGATSAVTKPSGSTGGSAGTTTTTAPPSGGATTTAGGTQSGSGGGGNSASGNNSGQTGGGGGGDQAEQQPESSEGTESESPSGQVSGGQATTTTRPRASGATGRGATTTRNTTAQQRSATGSGGSSGATDDAGESTEESVPEEFSGSGASSPEVVGRLTDLEGRVAALESRAYGGLDAGDQPVDPELKEELIAAADRADASVGQWSPVILGLVLVLLFGPFMRSGVASILGRRRRH
ncbi:MAG: phosphate ABC transporter substrate-binding protein PstS [Actinomycetota bacterium]